MTSGDHLLSPRPARFRLLWLHATATDVLAGLTALILTSLERYLADQEPGQPEAPPPWRAGALRQRRPHVADRQRRRRPSSCRSWTRSRSGSPSGSLARRPDPTVHTTAPTRPTQLPMSALSSDCRSAAPGTSMIHAKD